MVPQKKLNILEKGGQQKGGEKKGSQCNILELRQGKIPNC